MLIAIQLLLQSFSAGIFGIVEQSNKGVVVSGTILAHGQNPVEFLLHALAGCVTTTLILHATMRGIAIRKLSTELDGDMDLRGLLGLDPDVSPSYEEIRIRLHVEADCSDEELEDLLTITKAHSPVCNTVCRPVPVVLERAVA